MSAADARQRKILIVEDDPDLRADVAKVLSGAGFEVTERADGAAALSLLESGARFDILLLDLQMPVMDGWSFRAAQKRNPELSLIPVIVVTGDPSAQAQAIDASAVIRKPYGVQQLLDTITRTLAMLDQERARSAQLAQADRLASLGLLAAGVAHEINNPLAYVNANLSFISERIAAAAARVPELDLRDVREAIADCRDGAEKIRRIVRDLRCFARAEKEERRALDIHAVLELAVNMSYSEIRHRGRLIKDFGNVPLVRGDEPRLAQVFINLLVNAAHALPEGGAQTNEIRIVTRMSGSSDVEVEIRDTGKGIESVDLERIFEPFFSTKRVGEGTGLGLAIARQIIEAHDGTITVESRPSEGTIFRVTLRAAAGAVADGGAEPRLQGASALRGRVLVVDDDEQLCKSLVRGLASEHDVTAVIEARHALDLIASGQRFDAIFCDVMMPVMTGIDMFRALATVAPEQATRIIFLSGGVTSAASRAFLEQTPNPQLDKPFELHKLRELLRERLALAGVKADRGSTGS